MLPFQGEHKLTTPKLSKEFLELASQSGDLSNQAFDHILPLVAGMVSSCNSPEQVLGVVQALYRAATSLAYSTVGTKLDCLIRAEDQAAALGAAHWKAAAHMNARVLAELKKAGFKVSSEFQRSVDAVPATGDAKEAVEASSAPDPQEVAEKQVALLREEQKEVEGSVGATASDNLDDILKQVNSRGGGVS